MNAMNVESDDGTLRRPSAPPPPKPWCWCFPRCFPEKDWNDTAWYRRKTLQFFGLFTFFMFLSALTPHPSGTSSVMGSPPPNYEYLMESIPPATALDSLKMINTKALEGWVVDQFISPGIIACTEASSSHNLCPAILFKKPL